MIHLLVKDFVYLTAVVNWASRKVLTAKIAIALKNCHTVDVLRTKYSIGHGTLEIVDTDQGSRFTAEAFARAVKDRRCKLSMDGRGVWRDNVFVERLWKSVKYEEVYLHAYDSLDQTRRPVIRYLN